MRRLAADERGKISLATIFILLVMVTLLGLVANVGHAVGVKIELQNAADSAAYSTALWRARSLNAVTTCHHLLGEVTALVVLHESLGGPELDEHYGGSEVQTDEDEALEREISGWKNGAPYVGPILLFADLDYEFVEMIHELFVEGKQYSGATIYDARAVLKNQVLFAFTIKSITSTINGVLSATPVSAASNLVAVIVHLGVDVELLLLAKEWVVLQALEHGAGVTIPFKQAARELLIPALSQYGDFAAGSSQPAAVVAAIEATLTRLKEAHGVETLIVFPEPKKLTPPTRPEPPPETSSGTTSEPPPSEWKGREKPRGPGAVLERLREQINDFVGYARRFFEAADAASGGLGGKISGAVGSAIGFDVSQLTTVPGVGARTDGMEMPGNPSLESLPSFDWRMERRTQWVRATYPYVDSLRAGARRQFRNDDLLSFGVPASNAAAFLVHWSNRFTLVESYRLRSGEHSSGALPTPRMQVLVDMEPERKGRERWTTDDARAEKLFTLIAMAGRPAPRPLFFPGWFTSPERYEMLAYSQAITYNANGRKLANDNARQPNTGWDTLNWLPPVAAPEWGDHPLSESGPELFWDVILGGSGDASPGSRVQVNWQAKLVPVTVSRFREAAKSDKLPASLREPAELLRDHFELNTH
ncbi:MAG TPA: Tad domain-containing protein [Pirellulales bacterium]